MADILENSYKAKQPGDHDAFVNLSDACNSSQSVSEACASEDNIMDRFEIENSHVLYESPEEEHSSGNTSKEKDAPKDQSFKMVSQYEPDWTKTKINRKRNMLGRMANLLKGHGKVTSSMQEKASRSSSSHTQPLSTVAVKSEHCATNKTVSHKHSNVRASPNSTIERSINELNSRIQDSGSTSSKNRDAKNKTVTKGSSKSVYHNVPQESSEKLSFFKFGRRFHPRLQILQPFSWELAKKLMLSRTKDSSNYDYYNVPFHKWELTHVPTLGATPNSCRVQEMYKASLSPLVENATTCQLFIKMVPIDVWQRLWNYQDKYNGEYVTDGENFVMEAAVLAFLDEYTSGLAPKLITFLRHAKKDEYNNKKYNSVAYTHMALVTELYGQDMLDYLDERDKSGKSLTSIEKRQFQLGAVRLVANFHATGLAHLDITPENILVGDEGFRLCDFSKATPLRSSYCRHLQSSAEASSKQIYSFESCEPTIAKGAYMPPECWALYWRLENCNVHYPLRDLAHIQNASERKKFYFSVRSADAYMVGVLLFWIWADGSVWKSSDPYQDERYWYLVQSQLNFDLFSECRNWPKLLKRLLQKSLKYNPDDRATVEEILGNKWWTSDISSIDSRNASKSEKSSQSSLLLRTIAAGFRGHIHRKREKS